MFRSVRRFADWWGRQDETACIITSMVDFDQAVAIAEPKLAEILRAGRNSPSVIDQIGAAVSARLVLAAGMTEPELIRYVQHLQNRYSVAVGPSAYGRYLQGVPTDVFKDQVKLKAELQTLSYRLRLAYAITHLRDEKMARIRWACFWMILASLLILVGLVAIEEDYQQSFPLVNFIFVALVGLIGALTSIARRAHQILSSGPLEDDPIIQASALQQGVASLFIAGLTGPVFALVILLLFMFSPVNLGDLKALTPEFTRIPPPHYANVPDFSVFQYVYWLKGEFDAAKLLLWAFVAGFAEQFVPDVLDRFTKPEGKKAQPRVEVHHVEEPC